MNNIKAFIEDDKFKELSLNNQQAILKLDKCLESEGYIFNGNWRDDYSTGGSNSSFELLHQLADRKNLVTLRPMKSFLKVEVYWGYSKSIPADKKPKQYYKVHFGKGIQQNLLDEISEFYNYLSMRANRYII